MSTSLLGIFLFFFRFALMAVVPDRRKDCTKRLEMLKTNKMITIDALTHLVEQHDGRTSKHIDKDDKAIEQLEIDVTRVLKERKLKKKISSRTSSLDSSCPPGSPFQVPTYLFLLTLCIFYVTYFLIYLPNSFLNLEIVENSNSSLNISIFSLIN